MVSVCACAHRPTYCVCACAPFHPFVTNNIHIYLNCKRDYYLALMGVKGFNIILSPTS